MPNSVAPLIAHRLIFSFDTVEVVVTEIVGVVELVGSQGIAIGYAQHDIIQAARHGHGARDLCSVGGWGLAFESNIEFLRQCNSVQRI